MIKTKMGNKSTKSNLRESIILLTISANSISINDDKFWNKILLDDSLLAENVIKSISTRKIRTIRDGSPKNFASLAYKMIEKLYLSTGTLCNSSHQQLAVLNSARILTRILPCMFEHRLWREFFFTNSLLLSEDERTTTGLEPDIQFPKVSCAADGSEELDFNAYLPANIGSFTSPVFKSQDSPATLVNDGEIMSARHLSSDSSQNTPVSSSRDALSSSELQHKKKSLAHRLIHAICDLLFCPEFTVSSKSRPNNMAADSPPEDIKSLDSCDYVWEPGVGFEIVKNSTQYYDKARSELLRLLLTCISSSLYTDPTIAGKKMDPWIKIFSSKQNRHALALFTSLLNTVFRFRPSSRLALPLSGMIFEDHRCELVKLSLQTLIAVLDCSFTIIEDDNNDKNHTASLISTSSTSSTSPTRTPPSPAEQKTNKKRLFEDNLFITYLSRIHREQDLTFIVSGLTRLLGYKSTSSSLISQGYFSSGASNSKQVIDIEQELLVFLWRLLNINQNFMCFLLKAQEFLDITSPILMHLNDNFLDQSRTAHTHIGVFILLKLSGERNFGVRLNKHYEPVAGAELPSFTGSHADLIIVVFFKIIYYGQTNLFRIFDYLLSIIVNISPYIKSLSFYSSQCLVQLFEIFSSSTVIFTNPRYHQPVVFLLEIFNNIIQYQFDGNANLIFAIVEKKKLFHNLSKLPTSKSGIQNVLAILSESKKERSKLEAESKSSQKQKSSCCKQPQIDKKTLVLSQNLNTNQNDLFGVTDFSQKLDATLMSRNSSDGDKTSSCSLGEQKVSIVATPEIEAITSAVNVLDCENSSKVFADDKSTNSTNNDSHFFFAKDNNDQVFVEGSLIKPDNNPKDCEFWSPCPDWVKKYKASLPIQTILRMLEVLEPQLARFEKNQELNKNEFIKFIQNGTLVGLLPVPHPILIRKYRTNSETILWFRACTWGIIYVKNSIWADTNVKLVTINNL